MDDTTPGTTTDTGPGTAAGDRGTAGLDRLTPLQRSTLELLRRSDEPVVFDPDVVAEIVDDVTEAHAEFVERLEGSDLRLFVNKHRLTNVLGCEVHHLHDEPFTWSPAVAGGQLAHRAVQLLVHWRGDPVPADLVDEALARVVDEETGLGDWVASRSEAELSDLRGFGVDKLIKFMECFPPLPKAARPRTETSVRWPNDGPLILSGKADLVIGRPEGEESRKVIIDLKTGWVASRHREDLRFYALIETMQSRVPPRKLASFYLDAGTPVVEDVTEPMLRSTARRVLDAIHAEIELRVEGRPPVKRPGTTCRWCPLVDGCDEGREHLAALDDER